MTKEYESFVQHAERGDWSLIDEDDVGMEAPEDSAKYKPLTQKVRIEHQPKDPDAGRVERGNRSRR